MSKIINIVKEEQGSSLITVLIIALIVALFIGAVLGGIYLQSRFIQRDINRTKALYKAEQQAFEFLHSGISPDSTGNITSTDFGGFQLIYSSSRVVDQEVKLELLFGAIPDSIFNYAVALKDTNSALNITGRTVIKGDVATGSNEVSKSTFKGFPFRGTFEGEARKGNMNKFFPSFDYSSIENQLETFESFFAEWDVDRFLVSSLNELEESIEGDTVYFEDSQEWELSESLLISKKAVVIVNGNLSITGDGNLGDFTTFIAKDTLSIGGSIKGTHNLVNAGMLIEIKDQAQINAQLVSRGRIVIKDQAYLSYPSLVYSSSTTYLGEQPEVIHLQDESTVDGMVIYPVETGAFNREQFRIKIDEEATVRGSVYNLGQTELVGSVYGSVLTKQFYFYESPTSYINWLKDAEIDHSKIPKEFVAPIGFSDSTRYTLLSWREVAK